MILIKEYSKGGIEKTRWDIVGVREDMLLISLLVEALAMLLMMALPVLLVVEQVLSILLMEPFPGLPVKVVHLVSVLQVKVLSALLEFI